MGVLRPRTKQLRAPLTTTHGHPKSMQCNFNSCSFNYKSDYDTAHQALELDYFNEVLSYRLEKIMYRIGSPIGIFGFPIHNVTVKEKNRIEILF